MNLPSIEEPSSHNFFKHSGFDREIEKFERKFSTIKNDLSSLEKILDRQFHPIKPMTVITANMLHCISKGSDYEMWKVICSTQGLRKNQMPRIYFARYGTNIYFLCMGTHIDNYDDAQLRKTAVERAGEYF